MLTFAARAFSQLHYIIGVYDSLTRGLLPTYVMNENYSWLHEQISFLPESHAVYQLIGKETHKAFFSHKLRDIALNSLKVKCVATYVRLELPREWRVYVIDIIVNRT